MKNINVLILLLTHFTVNINAQNKIFGITSGLSAFNAKSVSVNYETRINSRNYLGVFAETFFYSGRKWPLRFRSDESHYYAGLYYKPLLYSSRNFSHYILLGAAAGTHNRKFLYYPFAGLEQHLYIGNKTIFFTGEELKYLLPLESKWQPFIKTGFKIALR